MSTASAGRRRQSCSPTASSRCCLLTQVVLLVVRWLFTPQVIAILAPGFADDPDARRARGRADPHHLSLSAAGHAGDALWRHAQRDPPLRQRGGGADPAQPLDDGDAGARGVLSRRRPCGGLGRADRRLPRIFPAGRRRRRAAASCRASRRSSSTRTSAPSSARSGRRRSARWARRSRCSPTPSSRPSCRRARCRRCITPTGSTSCRSA